MAALSRAVVCQERDNRMTDKKNNSLTPVATQPGRLPDNQPAGPSPVRVKLRRVNASLAEPYPPDGEKKVWWKRLKKALGTKSSDFVAGSGRSCHRHACMSHLLSGRPCSVSFGAISDDRSAFYSAKRRWLSRYARQRCVSLPHFKV
jgi:hypothetical protein